MVSKYERLQNALTASFNCSNGSYPARFHKDVELVCVEDGFLEMQIDKSQYRLESGDVCIVFPNILHSVIRQECRKHLIMVSPALIPEFNRLFSQYKPHCPVLPAQEVPDVIPVLFQRCTQLYTFDGNRNIMIAHINSILSELLREMSLQPRSSEPELVQKIVEFILARYTEDISLEQLAQAVDYSKFYVSRCLNDTFGCNFRTLANNYRISAAEEMLLHSGKSITEIAYTCGFPNQSSFNRAFLKYCGMTPSQYKKENLAKSVSVKNSNDFVDKA